MVWWVHKYKQNHCKFGVYFGLDVAVDRIVQTINIMFDCHNNFYDTYDIQALLTTGVNIFNIDRTVHDGYFYEKVKGIIKNTNEICECYPSSYYRPIGLSVTMSVLEPVDIDNEVDILILKNVMKKEQFLEFRKQNKNSASMPILLMLAKFNVEDTNELIKISDGIILDMITINFIDEVCDNVTEQCKKAGKPVIYLMPKLAEEYYEPYAADRQILTTATQLVDKGVDGVMLVDSNELTKPPTEIVLSLVKGIWIAENDVQVDEVYYKQSFEMDIPVLPPLSTAMAASLGALKVGAKAILIMTVSGKSARVMSFAAPPCTVLAITTRKETARRLHLYRKVVPLFYDKGRAQNWHQEWRNRVDFGTDFGLKTGLFCTGAKLVVLAPSEESTGYCDGFQIVAVPFICNE
ncbi:pyruvate kinase isoform X2 [Manduca sexta]|uniref:pyruvate kinase isoform X2 n=1 Tax=Manduca sexta TaxID=7130 RepID=UPI00188F15B2|nr:pyruvate kinase isoform X2 [Manduca sexta]